MLKHTLLVPLAVLVLVGAGCQSSMNTQTQVNTAPSRPVTQTPPAATDGNTNGGNTGNSGAREQPMIRNGGKATVAITGDLPFAGSFDAECRPDNIDAGTGIKYGVLPPMKEVAPGQMALPWIITFSNTSHRLPGEQNLSDSDVQYNFTTRNTKGQIVTFEVDKNTSRLVFSDDLHQMTFKGDLKGMFNDLKGHADITVTCDRR